VPFEAATIFWIVVVDIPVLVLAVEPIEVLGVPVPVDEATILWISVDTRVPVPALVPTERASIL